MVNLKNQKGYVLLIVMMLIMVFSVLGISLLSLNITSAKQFNNKEKLVQARHTAEMGALHYKAYIAEEWKSVDIKIKGEVGKFNKLPKDQRVKQENLNNSKDIISSLSSSFCNDLVNKSLNLDEYTYTVTPSDMTVFCKSPFLENTDWMFTVTSQNKKTIQNEKVVKLSATVKITPPLYEVNNDFSIKDVNSGVKKPKKDKDKDDPSSNPNIFNEDVFVTSFSTATHASIIFNKNVYIENSINLQPHSCVVVKGDFKVEGSLNVKNDTTLFIFGDADLPSNYKYHTNHGGIFVSGKLYIDGVFQDPKPYMGINPKVNPGNCVVPSGFIIKNPLDLTAEPVLTVIYN